MLSTKINSTHNQSLLATIQLNCVRGESTLFQGLNLSINAGQCLHVVGANGSGKTSLLRILCGLNREDSGELFWRGEPQYISETFATETAYIGHKDGLKNELTALENLTFQQTLAKRRNEDQLDDVLAQLKILRCADLPVQVLSFGQRRRLAFAKLLLFRTPLWILDEPFTGIDMSGRILIEQLCVNHLEHGGAIVLTHHQSLQASPLYSFSKELKLENFAPKPAISS